MKDLSTYAQHTEDVVSAGSFTLWTGFNLEMKEVHLDEPFPSFLFLTSLLFALPKLPISKLGIAAVKVTVESAAL